MRPMPIIRSRTGCFTCRRRKKKCNEEKPICSGCKRNRLECHWPSEANAKQGNGASSSTSSAGVVTAARQRRESIVAAALSSAAPRHQQQQPPSREQEPPVAASTPASATIASRPAPPSTPSLSPTDVVVGAVGAAGAGAGAGHGPGPESGADAEMADPDDGPGSPSASATSSSESSGTADGAPDLVAGAATGATAAVPAGFEPDPATALALTVNPNVFPDSNPALAGISMPMSMLPQQSHHSYELLSYYLSRTANSMGNGSTEVNPFVAKLIPLAFSQPLVLQLILAQSAAHRQASEERLPTDEVAQRYYTDSLRMFRNVVSDYVSGRDANTLVLTVGSLILCLTEVAKGDIHGTIFDHFTASKSLLQMFLSRPRSEISDDLPDFLVEYYMHIAASSIISLDRQSAAQPVLSPEIEQLARALVQKKYVGQLCGCWLELLLLIPQVFQLGQSMMATAEGTKVSPSSDDIITFGFLQSQILAFFPDPLVNPHSRLAGLVFKQAVLLYLWTILGNPFDNGGNSAHKNLVDGAVSEAVSLLSQFPATLRINTSLCWPLAVIGCCTSDPAVQQFLRSRLETTFEAIGLGNMRQTLVLLDLVWRQPLEKTSPWTLCKSMREHQIWISFA